MGATIISAFFSHKQHSDTKANEQSSLKGEYKMLEDIFRRGWMDGSSLEQGLEILIRKNSTAAICCLADQLISWLQGFRKSADSEYVDSEKNYTHM